MKDEFTITIIKIKDKIQVTSLECGYMGHYARSGDGNQKRASTSSQVVLYRKI